jgi:PKD repeat protein
MFDNVFRVKAAAAFFAVLMLSLFVNPAFAGQASLAWNASASSGVTGYKVHYGTASRSYSTHLDVGNKLTSSVPNLTAGTTYYFAVTAYNAAGESGYSNEASATIPAAPDTQAPGLPSNLAASANGTTAINLNWTASTDNVGVTNYRVERCQGAGCANYAQVAAPAGTSYGDTGLTAGTSYSYRVRASDAAGNLSGYSAVATATTTTGTSPLAADFSASRTVGSAPMAVAFTNASTGVISSYTWNFGDGTSSNAKNPSHIYAKPGAYSVSLTVFGTGGEKTTTKSGLVKVGIDNDLAFDFGATYGIWFWLNNTTWSQLHGQTSKHMILADVDHNGVQDQVVDFGSQYGIWIKKNNLAWEQLDGRSVNWIVKADVDNNGQDDLIMDFGAQLGIHIYMNGGSTPWSKLHSLTAKQVVIADVDHNGRDDIVLNFDSQHGVWAYLNGGSGANPWLQLDARSPDWMIKADVDHNGQDDLVLGFGAGTGAPQGHPGKGVWAYMNGGTAPWRQLDYRAFASTQAIAVDIDNNGQDDLAINFASQGIWIYRNDTDWIQLHSIAAKRLAKADIDSNGIADLVVDFGPSYGVHILMNGRSWTHLNGATTSGIFAGQVDGR